MLKRSKLVPIYNVHKMSNPIKMNYYIADHFLLSPINFGRKAIMIDLVDIYAKLILAVLGFVAPLIILMISLFKDGLENFIKRKKAERDVIAKVLSSQANADETIHDLVSKSNKQLNEIKKDIDEILDIMELKKQIKWLFGYLIVAFILSMLYFLYKANIYDLYNIYLSWLIVVLSMISFSFGVRKMWKLFKGIIKVEEVGFSAKSSGIDPVKNRESQTE